MWSSHLFWKLFLVYSAPNILLALGFLTAVSLWQKQQAERRIERHLHDVAVVAGEYLTPFLSAPDSTRIQSLVSSISRQTGIQLTLMNSQGVVVADSHYSPAEMDNHHDQFEIRRAASHSHGMDIRRRAVSDEEVMYVAVRKGKGEDAGFVRAALPLTALHEQNAAIRQFAWLFGFLILLLAAAAMVFIGNRLIRPLTELTHCAQTFATGEKGAAVFPLWIYGRDEIAKLGAAFYRMRRELSLRMNELHENSRRLEAVLSGMAEGVMAVDGKNRILFANTASRRLLAFVTENVINRPLVEATRIRSVHQAVEEARAQHRPAMQEFETPGAVRRRLQVIASELSGEPVAGSGTNGAPAAAAASTVTGVVIVLHDVSELRRLENLRQELVANVSHELKTPLASIKAHAETLRLGAIHDPKHNVEFLARIEEQAERLHQLILDMLHIARMESGKESFEIVDAPLADVVESCLSRYAPVAEAKNITLEAAPPDDASHNAIAVRADEEGLQTILDNLVDNAIKYTPQGGRVVIRWRYYRGQGVLEVEDNGIGIRPEDQTRVFERFYRADKARSREMGGTGLGLSIVKHLAQAFGGSISLTSEPNQGSKFQVFLPLA